MNIIINLIYILQSEYYDVRRFVVFAYTHPQWWRLAVRGELVWTKKVYLLLTVLTIFLGVIIGVVYAFWGIIGVIVIGIISILLLPILIVISLGIISPIDYIMKQQILRKAYNIIVNSDIIVVGITGSYGKTTTKEILAQILEEKFKIIKTPENINTDIGIAQFIIAHAEDLRTQEIFIVEMGAHRRGDIAQIVKHVVPVEHCILTGITSAHLDRFGSLQAIIDTKFELPQNTKELIVLNCDDENISIEYKKQLKEKEVSCIRADIAQDITYKSQFAGITFKINKQEFETQLIAQYVITLILLAREIAQKLGMTDKEIAQGVAKIAQIPHRLEVLHNTTTNRVIIDDSYNGNIVGADSALDVLARADGRKVVLTPGLVELGDDSRKEHIKLAMRYAKIVDMMLLIQSPEIRYIIDGLDAQNFTNYKIYETAQKAHDDLANVLEDGDTILFQNDVTDNYL